MNRVLIILLILVSSCQNLYKSEERIERFENILKIKFSLENKFFDNSHFTDGSIINRPAGSWQRLIATDNFCLNYKIPQGSKKGVLQIVSSISEGECPKLPTKKEIVSVNEISKLKVKFSTDHINGKTIRNGIFGIVLDYEHATSARKLVISLPNMERSKTFINSKIVKYSSSGTYRMDKGVRVTKDSTKKIKTELWYGSWKEKETNKRIVFCEKKNNSCEILGRSNCDECLYGWDYLVDYNCSGGGSKACSPVKCGEKGRPACSRGVIWSGRDMRELCFDDSPAGFCKDDLKVICGEDGILICV